MAGVVRLRKRRGHWAKRDWILCECTRPKGEEACDGRIPTGGEGKGGPIGAERERRWLAGKPKDSPIGESKRQSTECRGMHGCETECAVDGRRIAAARRATLQGTARHQYQEDRPVQQTSPTMPVWQRSSSRSLCRNARRGVMKVPVSQGGSIYM